MTAYLFILQQFLGQLHARCLQAASSRLALSRLGLIQSLGWLMPTAACGRGGPRITQHNPCRRGRTRGRDRGPGTAAIDY